jgi:hypothetical protein
MIPAGTCYCCALYSPVQYTSCWSHFGQSSFVWTWSNSIGLPFLLLLLVTCLLNSTLMTHFRLLAAANPPFFHVRLPCLTAWFYFRVCFFLSYCTNSRTPLLIWLGKLTRLFQNVSCIGVKHAVVYCMRYNP